MLSDRRNRHTLYGLTCAAWVACGILAAYDTFDGVDQIEPLLTLVLAAAISLFTASLMAIFIAPLAHIYRAGVEDGKAHNDPPLRLISND